MEYGLGAKGTKDRKPIKSLNPCCNGIWSRSYETCARTCQVDVLILVVMEYGLGVL